MPKNRPALRKPFVPKAAAEETIRSAKIAIRDILRMQILERHKRKLISTMIWKVTEAHGKWKTRYRSQGVLRHINATIQHEHVYRRKLLADELIASPECQEAILEKAVACVVTEEEHRKLSTIAGNTIGWDRYRKARIAVYDMVTSKRFL